MKKASFLKSQLKIDNLLTDKNTSLAIKAVFVLIGVSWLSLPLFWRKLPPQVPIVYSRPWGEEQLLNKPFIILLPGLATLLTLINLKLASLFFSSYRPLSYFLIWFNFVACFLAGITYWKILFIVT